MGKRKEKEKNEDEKLRREIKEEVYTRYTDMVTSFLSKDYYQGFQSTLSTFLALNMATEATKKNLIKMGIPIPAIEDARRSIIEEIWNLMKLQESGALQQLMEQYEKDAQQREKK
jgi:hypothetical protein